MRYNVKREKVSLYEFHSTFVDNYKIASSAEINCFFIDIQVCPDTSSETPSGFVVCKIFHHSYPKLLLFHTTYYNFSVQHGNGPGNEANLANETSY